MALKKDQLIYETLGSYFSPSIRCSTCLGRKRTLQPTQSRYEILFQNEWAMGALAMGGGSQMRMSSWSQVPALRPEPQSRYCYRSRTTLLTWTNVLTLTNYITTLYTLYHVALRMILPPRSCFWYNIMFLPRLPTQLLSWFFPQVSKFARCIPPDIYGKRIKGNKDNVFTGDT